MMSISSGRWVFDSNLLVYGLDRDSRFYLQTRELFTLVHKQHFHAVIAQQNILEATRTFVLQYSLPREEVIKKISGLITDLDITVITPQPFSYQKWFQLLDHTKRNVDLFDHYLAATMLDNGIQRILTLNTKDFAPIAEIEAVNPFVKEIR